MLSAHPRPVHPKFICNNLGQTGHRALAHFGHGNIDRDPFITANDNPGGYAASGRARDLGVCDTSVTQTEHRTTDHKTSASSQRADKELTARHTILSLLRTQSFHAKSVGLMLAQRVLIAVRIR